LDGGSAFARPLPIHRTIELGINADRHPCLQWDSNPRPQCFRNHVTDENIIQPFSYKKLNITVMWRKIHVKEVGKIIGPVSLNNCVELDSDEALTN
jgi:hypothetical protein